jgi:hypothetical protein
VFILAILVENSDKSGGLPCVSADKSADQRLSALQEEGLWLWFPGSFLRTIRTKVYDIRLSRRNSQAQF